MDLDWVPSSFWLPRHAYHPPVQTVGWRREMRISKPQSLGYCALNWIQPRGWIPIWNSEKSFLFLWFASVTRAWFKYKVLMGKDANGGHTQYQPSTLSLSLIGLYLWLKRFFVWTVEMAVCKKTAECKHLPCITLMQTCLMWVSVGDFPCANKDRRPWWVICCSWQILWANIAVC